MGKVQGKLLVGVINSIAVRRDPKAVSGLVKKLKDADPEVASAAAVALGRIGGSNAAKALSQSLPGAPAAVSPAIAGLPSPRRAACSRGGPSVRVSHRIRARFDEFAHS
jgi:HEAT repeat protein